MSVTIPSDLVLNVMRAAPPDGARSAAMKLAGVMAVNEAPKPSFEKVVEGVGRELHPLEDVRDDSHVVAAFDTADRQQLSGSAGIPVLVADNRQAMDDSSLAAYRSFEQVFLRNMLESTLPPPDSGLYGDKTSAGAWRSLTADHLAKVFSDAGGIGIAETLSLSQQAGLATGTVVTDGSWPYFSTPGIKSFVG